jgi:hypothetical protein
MNEADEANKKANIFFAPPFCFSVQAQIGLNVLPPFLARYSETKNAYERPELQRRRLHRSQYELVMFGVQPLECAPAHPLRLDAAAVEDAWFPA